MENTTQKRAAALLDILPRRGPKAFHSFCEALMESEQDFICEMIDQEFAKNWEEQHIANVTTAVSQPSDSQQPEASRPTPIQRLEATADLTGKGIIACGKVFSLGILS